MKKTKFILTLLYVALTANLFSQQVIAKTDREIYSVEGPYNFIIVKKDLSSGKILFKAETNIPDKKEKEGYYVGNNDSYFFLIEDQIFMIYDVWQKSSSSKQCYVKLLNTKTAKFSEKQLIYSTELNSAFSIGDIRYRPVFSPDLSKFAVMKENRSPGYNIDPEISIYETESFKLLSNRKFAQKYEGQKRVFDSKFSMDDEGNISLIFHQLNEQTKLAAKGFSADLDFGESDFKNIKQLGSSENAAQSSGDHFYKTLQDYIDDKPIKGVRIKTFRGSLKFELIDDAGNVSKADSKKLPSQIFVYNSYLMRIIDNTPYIVLAAGAYNHYADYNLQSSRFYSEGWNGELEKFKEGKFEDILEQYGLLESYKKDKPKREFKDDVNGYFNKVVAWQNNYFVKLNQKIKGE